MTWLRLLQKNARRLSRDQPESQGRIDGYQRAVQMPEAAGFSLAQLSLRCAKHDDSRIVGRMGLRRTRPVSVRLRRRRKVTAMKQINDWSSRVE
jgi:hypothetical protein